MQLEKQNIPFTMVANEVLVRADVTLQEKGLFAYLFSKPQGWEFSADRIASETKEDRKTIQRVLKKLESSQLLKRTRLPNGKMQYLIRYSTRPPEGLTSLFSVEKASPTVSSKDIMQAPVPISAEGAKVNQMIDLFKPINPSHDRLFRNKTQRAAMERMLEKHGEEKVRGMLSAAQACYGKEYCPTITTPVQLEEKLGSLASAMQRMGRKAPAVVSI